MSIVPWTDGAFLNAVHEACREVLISPDVDPCGFTATARVEGLLHAAGFGHARVMDARTTDEALRRVGHWLVLRDGEETMSGGSRTPLSH